MPKQLAKKFLRFSLITVLLWLQIYRVCGTECGRSSLITNRILGGNTVSRGSYPFIAALYRAKQSKYFCGGTLISSNHILTAANCIKGKGSTRSLLPEDIEVRLGAHNLTKENEQDAVRIHVSQIIVHPDWNINTENYDADVAILVLSDNITFTKCISPVCLPADETEFSTATIDAEGKVVGWGLGENKTPEEIPKEASIRALNDSFCYRSDAGVVHLSSPRTFCGGHGEGTPNIGDSGGGFFMLNDDDTTWVQYGIISASRTNLIGKIVRSSYSVYGNVKLFKEWIVKETQINCNSSRYTFS